MYRMYNVTAARGKGRENDEVRDADTWSGLCVGQWGMTILDAWNIGFSAIFYTFQVPVERK